ncbi:MAG: hypothetical protein K2N29_01560, partial [Ruminiclostridium sp.]|nr:hypothetical protein [Ruminiclostridium sp.]
HAPKARRRAAPSFREAKTIYVSIKTAGGKAADGAKRRRKTASGFATVFIITYAITDVKPQNP